MLKLAQKIQRYGMMTGLTIAFMPLAYDVIGIFYGRGFYEAKLTEPGYVLYALGFLIIALTVYIRRNFNTWMVEDRMRRG